MTAAPGLWRRLSEAAADIGPIGKDEKNKQQGFDYRSIEQITAKARKVFADKGIGIVPSKVVSLEVTPVTSSKGSVGYRTQVVMEYTLGCEVDDGKREEITLAMAGEAIDYGDKATSKAVQMAFKYALTEALIIGAEADNDGHAPEPVFAPAKRLGEHMTAIVGEREEARLWAKVGAAELGIKLNRLNDEKVDQLLEWARLRKESGEEVKDDKQNQEDGAES